MRVSAKSDYAIRALVELATRHASTSSELIAEAQDISHKYLEAILVHLRKTGFVSSVRGHDGGYRLARDPATIWVADVIRSVDGPITLVRGDCPQDVAYQGSAALLQDVWIALRANIRAVLERVSIADLANGSLPSPIKQLAADGDAWTNHWYAPTGKIAQ